MKSKLFVCVMVAVMVMGAVSAFGASSKRKEQPKISDEVFLSMCESGTAKSVQYAIRSRGANVNAKVMGDWHTDEGDTALMRAIMDNRDPEVAKTLISAGADVNAKSKYGYTALMYELGVNLDEKKKNQNQNPEIVKALIAAGADVNAKGLNGWTALMYADNPEIVKALIAAGADVNAKEDCGWTALLVAAGSGNLEVVKILISAGANINAKGFYPGYGAADIDSEIDLGKEMYVTKSDGTKHADNNDKPDSYSLFSEANAVDEGDATALICAVDGENLEIVNFLISAGADINARGDNGRTAIMSAASRKSLEILNTLIKAGAKDLLDDDGQNALMRAAKWCDNSQIITTLIKAGSPINLKDKDGQNALMLASRWNENPEIIATLIKAGSPVNLKDKDGNTALKLAQSRDDSKAKTQIIAHPQTSRRKRIITPQKKPSPKNFQEDGTFSHLTRNASAESQNPQSPQAPHTPPTTTQ